MKHTIEIRSGDRTVSVKLDEEQCEAIVDGMAFVVRHEREKAVKLKATALPRWRKYVALCIARIESAESVSVRFASLRQPEFPRLQLEGAYV